MADGTTMTRLADLRTFYALMDQLAEKQDGPVWTCTGFAPFTYLIMPPWLRKRAG